MHLRDRNFTCTKLEFLAVADELKHLASVEKIITTPRRQLHKVIPVTINGLYGMAYALAASVNAENLSKIMNVVDALENSVLRSGDEAPSRGDPERRIDAPG